MKVSRSGVANSVSVLSAFFSVLPLSCCVFPMALSFLGASGLAFAAALTPYRPYFIGLTLISLGTAFYFTYRPQKDCAPDEACAVPRRRRFQVVLLWVVTALVLILMVFPYLVPFLPL
jgi:mercuric ion transport protein